MFHRVLAGCDSLVDECHMITGSFDLREHMGTDENGLLAPPADDQITNSDNLVGIQTTCGFVEQIPVRDRR